MRCVAFTSLNDFKRYFVTGEKDEKKAEMSAFMFKNMTLKVLVVIFKRYAGFTAVIIRLERNNTL